MGNTPLLPFYGVHLTPLLTQNVTPLVRRSMIFFNFGLNIISDRIISDKAIISSMSCRLFPSVGEDSILTHFGYIAFSN